jgi:hypothetical protein
MKSLIVFILWSTAALATQVGDTLDQVIAEKGQPKSQVATGKNRILNYPDGSVHLTGDRVTSVKGTKTTSATPNSAPPKPRPSEESAAKPEPAPRKDPGPDPHELATLRNKRLTAINRVKAIVNQKVRAVRRTDVMKVSVLQPGWFSEGSVAPDFNKVDIRTTQELTYEKHEYVTSDKNPGVAFLGRDIEFNPMTKYFYLDRTLPKKKLTDSEMQEINRLYRVIGQCEDQLKNAEDY